MKTANGKTTVEITVAEDVAFKLERMAARHNTELGRFLRDLLCEASFESRVSAVPGAAEIAAFRARTA